MQENRTSSMTYLQLGIHLEQVHPIPSSIILILVSVRQQHSLQVFTLDIDHLAEMAIKVLSQSFG